MPGAPMYGRTMTFSIDGMASHGLHVGQHRKRPVLVAIPVDSEQDLRLYLAQPVNHRLYPQL